MRELTILPLLVTMMASVLQGEQFSLAAFALAVPRMSWLASVNDHIVRNPTMATRETCGSPVACSFVIANTLRKCEAAAGGSLYQAEMTLRLYGTIHYFNGPLRGKKPLDRSVVDGPTAVAHEYRRHIIPAANAVAPLLTQMKDARFSSLEQCESAATETSAAITARFRDALVATQEFERTGPLR